MFQVNFHMGQRGFVLCSGRMSGRAGVKPGENVKVRQVYSLISKITRDFFFLFLTSYYNLTNKSTQAMTVQLSEFACM